MGYKIEEKLFLCYEFTLLLAKKVVAELSISGFL